jgi:hypothetical protein
MENCEARERGHIRPRKCKCEKPAQDKCGRKLEASILPRESDSFTVSSDQYGFELLVSSNLRRAVEKGATML